MFTGSICHSPWFKAQTTMNKFLWGLQLASRFVSNAHTVFKALPYQISPLICKFTSQDHIVKSPTRWAPPVIKWFVNPSSNPQLLKNPQCFCTKVKITILGPFKSKYPIIFQYDHICGSKPSVWELVYKKTVFC